MKHIGFGIQKNHQEFNIQEHLSLVIVKDFAFIQFLLFFLVGIYGMFNIYVFSVLVLFSPIVSNVDDMDELSKNGNINLVYKEYNFFLF